MGRKSALTLLPKTLFVLSSLLHHTRSAHGSTHARARKNSLTHSYTQGGFHCLSERHKQIQHWLPAAVKLLVQFDSSSRFCHRTSLPASIALTCASTGPTQRLFCNLR